jgi:hypothetical protein
MEPDSFHRKHSSQSSIRCAKSRLKSAPTPRYVPSSVVETKDALSFLFSIYLKSLKVRTQYRSDSTTFSIFSTIDDAFESVG